MNEQLRDALILELAKSFASKQVNPAVVVKGLQSICTHFGFDCGLVYEIDQANEFHLQERFVAKGFPLLEQFSVQEIPAEYRCRAAEEELLCLQGAEGRAVLSLFSAKRVMISTITDEKTRLNGLLVFLKREEGTSLDAADRQALTVLLSLLSRYMSSRVYGNKLSFAQVSLERILDNTGIDIYVNDFDNHDILYVNRSMAAPYGGQGKFDGKKCWQVLFPGQSGPCEFCPQPKLIDDDGNPTKVYTWDYQRPFDGSWFRVFSAAFRWTDGRMAHVVSSADITDNKRNEELVQYLAHYDSLTSLPNRRRLVQDCAKRIQQGKEQGYLLFFDIDGFKPINDQLGHDAGDEFLVQLGAFFSDIPLLKDAIYRNGGDEFVAILGGAISMENVRSLARFIHARFEKPWVLKKGEVHCNTSIGVARYPDDGVEVEDLLQQADQAMYSVKKAGGGDICFAGE